MDRQGTGASHHVSDPMIHNFMEPGSYRKEGEEESWECADIFSPTPCRFNLRSYLMDLWSWTVTDNWLTVVPRLAAVFTPGAEVALVFAAPALGAV